MKSLRRAFSSFLAFALVLSTSSTARAVSLYDGVLTRATPTSPVVPVTPNAAIPTLDPAALSAIPNLPAVPTLDAAIPQIPQLPEAAAQTPQITQGPAAAPTATSALQATGAQLNAAPEQPEQALDPLFNGSKAASAAPTADAGISEHVGNAISEYFGVLSKGQQPGVVVAKKKQAGTQGAPTDGEMENNVKASAKTNVEREEIAIRMFQKAGAAYDARTSAVKTPDFTRGDVVQTQEVKGWDGSVQRNIFVVKKGTPKPGQKERIIVITSHNDKVEVGDGVIDNWTGTTMVAHLYQSIKDVPTEATYVFATFTREEEGLVGSKAFMRALSPAQKSLIEGNINYDTIAIKGGQTNTWENNSDEVLLDAADKAVAQANKNLPSDRQLDLKRAQLNGGDADSSTFRNQRPPIPAVTVFSGPEDLIFSIIHSAADNIGAFDFALYKNTYLVAMAIIHWLDAHPLVPTAAPAS